MRRTPLNLLSPSKDRSLFTQPSPPWDPSFCAPVVVASAFQWDVTKPAAAACTSAPLSLEGNRGGLPGFAGSRVDITSGGNRWTYGPPPPQLHADRRLLNPTSQGHFQKQRCLFQKGNSFSCLTSRRGGGGGAWGWGGGVEGGVSICYCKTLDLIFLFLFLSPSSS